MKKNGKKEKPYTRTKSDSQAVRRGEKSLKLHTDPNGDRASQTKSSSSEPECIGVCREDGKRGDDRRECGTDGEVLEELIQVTQECVSALEISLEAGKAYLDRLESIRSSVQKPNADSEN